MILRAVVAQVLELFEAEPELAGRLRGVLGAASTTTTTAPALLDRSALAKALDVSPATLDRLRGEAGFPELKIGDSPRFEVERVLAWLRTPKADDGNVLSLDARRAK